MRVSKDGTCFHFKAYNHRTLTLLIFIPSSRLIIILSLPGNDLVGEELVDELKVIWLTEVSFFFEKLEFLCIPSKLPHLVHRRSCCTDHTG